MKQKMTRLLIGAVVGAALLGGTAAHAAAEYLRAYRSNQAIYLDGQQVQLEAYNINGNNYVRLQDIGRVLDFNVYWDGVVQIDSSAPYTGTAPKQYEPVGEGMSRNADGSINILPDCPQYVPKAGDVIRCPDGSSYTITDVVRYDSNVFAAGPVGELPEATCDWSRFPELEMPDTEVRHFDTANGDRLFIRNQVETRRMQYTIYNALGNEPSAWRGNEPLASMQLSIPAELEAYTGTFWPWRASELTDLVHSRPASRYYVMAWDYYLNGVFQYTRYCVVSE